LPHQGLRFLRNAFVSGVTLRIRRHLRIGQLMLGSERIDFFQFVPHRGFRAGPIQTKLLPVVSGSSSETFNKLESAVGNRYPQSP